MSNLRIFAALAALVLGACHHNWPANYQSLALPQTAIQPGDVSVTWLGTAGIYATDGTTSIFIDPFVSRFGLVHVGLGRDIYPQSEVIQEWAQRIQPRNVALTLVSHSHYDHAMDAPVFAALTGSILVGSKSTLNIGAGIGLRPEQMIEAQPGKPFRIGNFKVTFIESVHGKALFGRVPYPGEVDGPLRPPAPAGDYKLGKAFSILVEHPRGTFLHHASAGWVPGMFKDVKADVVLLGIAGRPDSHDYVENVVRAVGAKRLVITHFDDFFVPLSEPLEELWGVKFDEFVATAKKDFPDLALSTLPLGEPRKLY
jgi:L-ascorbate metabolism protein UlaG (beta-lactamase superfamily)